MADSWIREAMHTMHVARSGRPFADMIRMAGTLGSSISDTAAVLRCTVEHLKEAVEGSLTISITQADLLVQYLKLLWWWHCYRLSRNKEETSIEDLDRLYVNSVRIWPDIPLELKRDWVRARERKETQNT
tara:strand:- start:237 stop:626 length:390 start_codon:yes stop_codon:yes gene_type:complete